MILPFSLPSWLPWWVPIVVLVPALLYVLVFLLVPFSVFGLKSRLDVIDARLDELQGEIRLLVLRLPPVTEEQAYDTANLRRMAIARPPIPPVPATARPSPPLASREGPDDEEDAYQPRRAPRAVDRSRQAPAPEEPPRRRPPPPASPPREEPRLDWPR
jgi:hypothetical protein